MSDVEATIRCDCGCAVLVLDYWKSHPADEGYLDVYTAPRPGLRHRLRAAWRVARGKDPWVDTLVFGPKQVAQLRAFLDGCAA